MPLHPASGEVPLEVPVLVEPLLLLLVAPMVPLGKLELVAEPVGVPVSPIGVFCVLR